MLPDLRASLRARYPALLPDHHAIPGTTDHPFRFTCDDGWFPLIDDHLATLQAMADDGRIAQPVAVQIKQKFGQLRASLRDDTPQTRALTEALRLKSATTCELCGGPGLLRWYDGVKTLCDDDAPFGTPLVWPQPSLEPTDAP